MVKKLFKHEIASYLRLLIPVYIILLSIGVMGRVIQCFETDSTAYDILRGSSIVALVIGIFSALLLSTIFCILRFYKNLFSGEGYLSFTLPVTSAQHINTKLSVAVLVEGATLLAALLSVFLFTLGGWWTELVKAGIYLCKEIAQQTGAMHFAFYVTEMILLLLVTVACQLLLYYMCISVGQTARKNRALAAVGVYFALYLLTQILSTVITILCTVFAEQLRLDELFELIGSHPIASTHIILIISILLSLLMGVVYYVITHWIIRKKLNLE